jgi:hypothetical protein
MKKAKKCFDLKLVRDKIVQPIFILFCFINFLHSGWNPAVFVETGFGARAISMGSAFVSIVGDGASTFWNPAGLGEVNNFEISFMGQSLADVKWQTVENITPKYQCINFVIPTKFLFMLQNPVLGIGWINNSLDGIPYTYIDSDGNLVRDEVFQSVDNAFLISYGDRYRINDKEKIYFGIGFRAITQQWTKIDKANAFGYDFVTGLIFKTGRTNLGFVINRGIILHWANGNTDNGPLGVKIGFSHRFFVLNNLQFMPSIDFVQKQTFPFSTNVGFEIDWMTDSIVKDIFFRGGITDFVLEDRYNYQQKMNEEIQTTFGTGLRLEYSFLKFSLDYMYGIYRLGNKHRFSFSLYF